MLAEEDKIQIRLQSQEEEEEKQCCATCIGTVPL
jgi:hypothetical protein